MALYLCVFHSLANIPLDDPLARAVSNRFSMQPNTIVAIWLGMGLIAILKWPTARFRGFPAVVFRYGVCMSLVLYQLHTGFHELRARWDHDDTLRNYAQGILHSLPQNAMLLSYTDINWNTIRYLQLCERQRGDVTHLSLQLMPFPWFPRQHHLLRGRNIHFPAISADVSMVKTSPGYNKYLQTFLRANLPHHGENIFLDLHGVNDGDIGADGGYHGVFLTPFGALWQVHAASITFSPDVLFERWNHQQQHARVPVILKVPSDSSFARGSWEFVAFTIHNDATYQAALYRLSHWIDAGGKIKNVDQLVAFVHGLHQATQALDSVMATIDTMPGVITYPEFDVSKNAALARIRFQVGLEVLVSMVNDAREASSSAAVRHKVESNTQLLEELATNVFPYVTQLREKAANDIRAFLPKLQAKNDPDLEAFRDFVDKYSAHTNSKSSSFPSEKRQSRASARQNTPKKKSKKGKQSSKHK